MHETHHLTHRGLSDRLQSVELGSAEPAWGSPSSLRIAARRVQLDQPITGSGEELDESIVERMKAIQDGTQGKTQKQAGP